MSTIKIEAMISIKILRQALIPGTYSLNINYWYKALFQILILSKY